MDRTFGGTLVRRGVGTEDEWRNPPRFLTSSDKSVDSLWGAHLPARRAVHPLLVSTLGPKLSWAGDSPFPRLE